MYEEIGLSQLHLAMSKNIEFVHRDSQKFMVDYLLECVDYIDRLTEFPEGFAEKSDKLYNAAIDKINSLQHLLFFKVDVPIDLLQAVEYVNSELIKMLKENRLDLHSLHWRAFEELIAELLSFFGWKVSITSKTRDNGYDIFAVNKDISGVTHSWLIECKKWSSDRPVGIDVIRSLYTVKNDLRVGNIMLATTSKFSPEVQTYKKTRYDLELREYQNIIDWINDYQPNPNGRLFIQSNRLQTL